MTMPDLRESWQSLRAHGSEDRAGDFRLRLCDIRHGVRLFAAVAANANALSLVIEIPEALRPSRLAGVQLRRVAVLTSDLFGLPAARSAIVLQLLDPAFEDLFADLADDVMGAARLAASAQALVSAVCAVVVRWRHFMDGHVAPLSDAEVRGLIGELAVLECLAHTLGPSAALAGWRSPFGSIRDFEYPDRTLEVKSYSPSDGAAVRINDPLQLEADHDVPLFLICQELGRSNIEGTSLPAHVDRVARFFAGDVRLAEAYRDSLAGAGYLSCHAPIYREGLALGDLHVFQVRDGFPRIASASVPTGVVAVRFSVPVASLAPFRIDRTAALGYQPRATERSA